MASNSMPHAQKFRSLPIILLAVSLLNLEVVLGATYYLRASLGEFNCNGTSSDTCVFDCDVNGFSVSTPKFYCHDVGDCQFKTSELNCGRGGTIFGGNAPNLHFTDPSNYMKNFTINGGASSNLHINCQSNGCGDLQINVGTGSNLYVDALRNGFYNAIINGGPSSNLHINCQSNGCGDLQINVGTGSNLYVDALRNGFYNAIINGGPSSNLHIN
eukprot:126742_1